MWVFAAIVAVVSFAFYIWRQFEVVDAHYSIIPNQLIAVGILYWILLCAFVIFLERQSLLTVLAFPVSVCCLAVAFCFCVVS